jgi:hypothetical protein
MLLMHSRKRRGFTYFYTINVAGRTSDEAVTPLDHTPIAFLPPFMYNQTPSTISECKTDERSRETGVVLATSADKIGPDKTGTHPMGGVRTYGGTRMPARPVIRRPGRCAGSFARRASG